MSFYRGARDIHVVWNDGTSEIITAYEFDPYIKDGILIIQVDYDKKHRYIPLTSIREWSMNKY